MDVAPHVDSLLRQEFVEVVEANHGDSLAEPPKAGTTLGGKRRSRNGIHVEHGFDLVPRHRQAPGQATATHVQEP